MGPTVTSRRLGSLVKALVRTRMIRVRMGEPRADTQTHLEEVVWEGFLRVRVTVLRLTG